MSTTCSVDTSLCAGRGASRLMTYPVPTYWYELSVAHNFAELDISGTISKRCLSNKWQRRLDRVFQCHLVPPWLLLLLGASSNICVLVYTEGPLNIATLVIAASGIVAILLFSCTLSLSVLQHVFRQYEFWFITVFNTLNWVSFGFLFQDTRIVFCVFAWLYLQLVIVVDASCWLVRELVLSAWIGILGIPVLATLVAFNKFPNQQEISITVFGVTVGNVVDVQSLTASTLFIFLLKIVLLKRRTVTLVDSISTPLASIPCVIVKSKITLVPLTNKAQSAGSYRRSSLTLRPQKLAVTQIDAFHTVFPSSFWYFWTRSHRRFFLASLYLSGFIGYGLSLVQTIRDFNHYVLSYWMGHEPARPHGEVKRWFDVVMAVVAFAGTAFFCGGCFAFYQRDLLRMLLQNFDFLFSWVQVTLFGVCLCDMVTWDVDRSLVIGSWIIWFYWALSLDALTPIVRKNVLTFPKLIATPVVLAVFVACLGAVYRVVFVPISGLEDHVIWRYEITPAHSISIQTREFFLGRVFIIQLWYFRQLYMLLKREPNDLYVLHSRINLVSAGETGVTQMSDRGKVFPSIGS